MKSIIFFAILLIGGFFFARWFFCIEMTTKWRTTGMIVEGISGILFLSMIGSLFLEEFIFFIFLSLGFSATFLGILGFNMITQPEWFIQHFPLDK